MRKKVKLRNKYTMAEFLEVMKTRSWSAGIPYEAKISGVTPMIVFPELDEHHQLWLQIADGSPFTEPHPVDMVYISYGDKARDLGSAIARDALIGATVGGSISRIAAKFSPNERKVKEQVLKLVEELEGSEL